MTSPVFPVFTIDQNFAPLSWWERRVFVCYTASLEFDHTLSRWGGGQGLIAGNDEGTTSAGLRAYILTGYNCFGKPRCSSVRITCRPASWKILRCVSWVLHTVIRQLHRAAAPKGGQTVLPRHSTVQLVERISVAAGQVLLDHYPAILCLQRHHAASEILY
jgi:hypothetical protein